MKTRYFFCSLVLIAILNATDSETRIPSYLLECYTKETLRGPQLPMNFQVFIDIIRKAEKYLDRTVDLRIFTSSILHRFKFDGIEYHKDLRFEDGVTPFGATGPQRTKNQVIEELAPGNYKQFPAEILTKLERCALHRALSNTIWEHESASTDKFCMERPTEKMADDKLLPRGMNNCPLEFGVILTPYGTVAPGPLIAGIAAALQPQSVAAKLLVNLSESFSFNDDEIDIMIPKNEMTRFKSMWLNSILSSDTKLDNAWASTIAGDLAEMAIYQGPLVGNRMLLGATGFWNSTMRPQFFYLLGKDGSFDATRAELVGDIDGFTLAKHLKKWTSDFSSLRLSEILDMYYSAKGISFDSNVRACNRGQSFWQVASMTVLEQQVYAISQILAYRRSVVHMTDEALKTKVHYAVSKFTDYVNHHLFPEIHCIKEKIRPKNEVLVTWDGAWSQEYTVDFLSVLLEDLDVSPFGSKIGFLDGNTGKWLLNVTDSPSSAHTAILGELSVARLNLAKIFDVANDYYTDKWNERRKNHTIGAIGQVIVVLAPLLRLSDNEFQSSVSSLKKLRSLHPDVNVIYYTTAANAPNFKSLLIAEEDYLIPSSQINDISKYILDIPNSIRPGPCNPNISLGIRDQFEDYVYPQEVNIYKLDARWRVNTKRMVMKIVGFGYGSLEICMWSQKRYTTRKEWLACRELRGNSEAKMVDYGECTDTNCPAIYYRVRGSLSSKKCTEIDCRTPEHIRYLMRIENIQCSSAENITNSLITLLVILFFALMQE